MPTASLLSRIKSCFGLGEKPLRMKSFSDGMGNFDMQVPEGWRYDEDIAVVDGRYTISFQSRDGLCQFSVSVDAQIPMGFKFVEYAKAELESPSSGIYTTVRKSVFHKMPAYSREYRYSSGARKFFGGGVMFFTGAIAFSLSWSAPEAKEAEAGAVFDIMKKSFSPRAGFIIRKAVPPGIAGREEA